MQPNWLRFAAISLALAVLALTQTLAAQEGQPPPTTQPATSAPPGDWVSRAEYEKLKKDQDEMKKQLQGVTDQLKARDAAAAPTTQSAQVKADEDHRDLQMQNHDLRDQVPASEPGTGGAVETLFAAKTEDEYFSPFDIMNPEHMRADMPMQIGQYKDMQLDMGFEVVDRVQDVHQHNVYINGVEQPGTKFGFQDPFANLNLLATIPDKLDVYFDLYIASENHPTTTYGHEGYILLKGLPAPFDTGLGNAVFDYVNVKAGAFDIDFGDGNYRRSNDGRVQRNPLIGNPLVDSNEEEIGAEIYSVKGPVRALVGIGGGSTGGFTNYGSALSYHGKIWGNPLPSLRTSVSAYYVDNAGVITSPASLAGPTNDVSDLYTSRSGGTFVGVFNSAGENPGYVQPQAGKDIVAVQADATWNFWPFEVYGNVGWTQDSDANGSVAGSPAERWTYFTVEPVYHITPALYLAARYGLASAESIFVAPSSGVATRGWVDRIEGGAGYWFTKNILIKAEYIYEQEHDFSQTGVQAAGVDAYPSPQFNGFLVEFSFAF